MKLKLRKGMRVISSRLGIEGIVTGHTEAYCIVKDDRGVEQPVAKDEAGLKALIDIEGLSEED